MSAGNIVQDKRQEILLLAARHGARNVRLFGSVARGEDDESSDIDLLVDAGPERAPWFPVGLAVELETLLGRKVDVVIERALRPAVRERVLREVVPL